MLTVFAGHKTILWRRRHAMCTISMPTHSYYVHVHELFILQPLFFKQKSQWPTLTWIILCLDYQLQQQVQKTISVNLYTTNRLNRIRKTSSNSLRPTSYVFVWFFFSIFSLVYVVDIEHTIKAKMKPCGHLDYVLTL